MWETTPADKYGQSPSVGAGSSVAAGGPTVTVLPLSVRVTVIRPALDEAVVGTALGAVVDAAVLAGLVLDGAALDMTALDGELRGAGVLSGAAVLVDVHPTANTAISPISAEARPRILLDTPIPRSAADLAIRRARGTLTVLGSAGGVAGVTGLRQMLESQAPQRES